MAKILLIAGSADFEKRLTAAVSELDTKLARLAPETDALTQIAETQPALIVVETSAIPPWMADIRSNPATRRIPVLAAGDNPGAALYVGITDVLSYAECYAALPEALADRMRVFAARDVLERDCARPLSALALKGLREFNACEFYECHETLEEAWNYESGPTRDLYRVILQVGLAYYQILRGNYQGARKMFLRTLQWFAALPDRCQGIDVAQLRADAAAARAHLEALGPERIADFDHSLIKPVLVDGKIPHG